MSTTTEVQVWPGYREFWRERVVRGSAILLVSTGLVAATNLFYNILLARILGASDFGHASALYTLLMLMTAVTLSFQIVTSKFIARNSEPASQGHIYASLLRRAWQVGLAIAVLMTTGSHQLKLYLHLPAGRDLILLAIAAGVYIPLGVRRGRLQGCYNFTGLAINVVVEVGVKFFAAMLFLHFGMGVTGVMTAVLLSIVAAYIASAPDARYERNRSGVQIAPFGEGLQAVLYFIGQVILSNLDILLVKHFFPPSEAGTYAAVALVGRVVFMLSWSVVSSMFPISAGDMQPQGGRSVLRTALILVGALTSAFITAVALAPEALWTTLLGPRFLSGTAASFSALLTEYAVMTGIYSIGVVVMMYEISRRTGAAAWVQLSASVLLALAIWLYHDTLTQVILVQLVVMSGLLAVVAVPVLFETDESYALPKPVRRLRPVSEEEIVAEFLRGEFYHPEYDVYRGNFKHLVERPDLDHAHENFIRRALLFRRRGRLWRELPPGTEWWEIELSPGDMARLRAFPRNDWRRFSGGGFCLTEMVARIKAELASGRESRFLKKLGAIACNLRRDDVPDAVMLIGVDDYQPLTIIEGNHRMAAAMLADPDSVHRRFRFYCGFSSSMNLCCWHKTDLRSLARYARHSARYIFSDADFMLARALREKPTETGTS